MILNTFKNSDFTFKAVLSVDEKTTWNLFSVQFILKALLKKKRKKKEEEEDEPQTVTNHIFQQLVQILTCLSSWRFHP